MEGNTVVRHDCGIFGRDGAVTTWLLLRWPSNVVAAVKTCIRLLPSFTRYGTPTVLSKLKLAAPMLPELPGWNASVDCIFHLDHVARFFDRELEAAKGTFEAA